MLIDFISDHFSRYSFKRGWQRAVRAGLLPTLLFFHFSSSVYSDSQPSWAECKTALLKIVGEAVPGEALQARMVELDGDEAASVRMVEALLAGFNLLPPGRAAQFNGLTSHDAIQAMFPTISDRRIGLIEDSVYEGEGGDAAEDLARAFPELKPTKAADTPKPASKADEPISDEPTANEQADSAPAAAVESDPPGTSAELEVIPLAEEEPGGGSEPKMVNAPAEPVDIDLEVDPLAAVNGLSDVSGDRLGVEGSSLGDFELAPDGDASGSAPPPSKERSVDSPQKPPPSTPSVSPKAGSRFTPTKAHDAGVRRAVPGGILAFEQRFDTLKDFTVHLVKMADGAPRPLSVIKGKRFEAELVDGTILRGTIYGPRIILKGPRKGELSLVAESGAQVVGANGESTPMPDAEGYRPIVIIRWERVKKLRIET